MCSGQTRIIDGEGGPMFSIQQLSDKIDELTADQLDVDAFEDWLLSASWGHYSVRGDCLSSAIAAVHHVLYSYKASEIEEKEVARELASAIVPFAPSSRSNQPDVVTRPEFVSGKDRASVARLRKRALERSSTLTSSDPGLQLTVEEPLIAA
jgi:hypothetical protein